MKRFKIEIIRKIAQFLANVIIKNLEVEKSSELFAFWMEKAVILDWYCKEKWNIYLD